MLVEPQAQKPELETPTMAAATKGKPPWRFTIGSMMLGIVYVAGLFSLPGGWGIVAFALSIPCVFFVLAKRLVSSGELRKAAYAFWGTAIPINILTALGCAEPESYALFAGYMTTAVVTIPLMCFTGIAWLLLLRRNKSVSAHAKITAVFSVFVLVVLPIASLWTLWPLHVAFRLARPSLDRLADEVAAGKPLAFPVHIGLYSVAGSRFDPVSGAVALLIESNPAYPRGFLRTQPRGPRGQGLGVYGTNLCINLDGVWYYCDDD
jgi:hypothetical protein